MPAIPYLDSYWVLPDRFLAGAYPGDLEAEKARHKIQSLIHTGIQTIVDLTQAEDSYYPYAKLLKQEAAEFNVELERLNFPIPDYDIPSIPLTIHILNTIDQQLAADRRVYVHCMGGIGRTGTIVGCFLARHCLSGEEALFELQNLRQDAASWFRRSPESDLQIEFVRRWRIGQ